jgi:hypothetical protein
MLEQILDRYEDDFLVADGFNAAIIGVDENHVRLVYSVSKCLRILENDMSEEEALEYFTFNISGAYMGEKTPIWCWDDFE